MKIEIDSKLAQALAVWFIERIKEVFGKMVEWVRSKWDTIRELIKEYKPIHESPVHPAVKRHVLQGLIVKHQVIDRKPKFIRARTTC